MTKFSVIIPVRSINAFLRENITHLKEVAYSDYEVIIVLDNPEDYDFGGDARFTIVTSGPVGPGEKRNIGARRATGAVLAFLDDDAYPAREWLTKADEVFKSHDCYALGGPAITPPNAPFREKMSGLVLEAFMASAGTVYRHKPKISRLINDYPTVNLFVEKADFLAVGGFLTEFWPGEDTKLCLDLVKKNGKGFEYSPEVLVYHHRRNLFIPHLKQVSRYGKHRGQFARIYPETSRLPAYFMPSLFVIGLIFGPFAFALFKWSAYAYLGVVLVYLGLLLAEGARVCQKEKNIKAGLYVMAGIFLTHVVYGVNFIFGYIKKPVLKLRGLDKTSGNYIGG